MIMLYLPIRSERRSSARKLSLRIQHWVNYEVFVRARSFAKKENENRKAKRERREERRIDFRFKVQLSRDRV